MANQTFNSRYHNRKDIEALLDRYKDGIATPEDLAFLESWYVQHNGSSPIGITDAEADRRLNEIRANLPIDVPLVLKPQKTRIKLWPGLTIAASLLIAMMAVLYYVGFSKSEIEILREAAINAGIAPGGNKAVLTLANGKKIVLTDAANGNIVSESGITVTKTSDGKIVYAVNQSLGNAEGNEIKWNTIETPKGGQYQIVLPDGSNVWLNAQSTLKFPSVFSAAMRKVEISGEAYFEVAKKYIALTRNRMPFVVVSGKQELEVLGTHFNINSYKDEESVKTTLLEGSVAIRYPQASGLSGAASKGVVLKQGEQSDMLQSGNIKVRPVNVQNAIDWQKGYFEFHDENVYEIMRKVSRWYDIEVVFEPGLPLNGMGGTLSRFQDVSKILDIMQSTGLVRFKIEGRKIYVQKT